MPTPEYEPPGAGFELPPAGVWKLGLVRVEAETEEEREGRIARNWRHPSDTFYFALYPLREKNARPLAGETGEPLLIRFKASRTLGKGPSGRSSHARLIYEALIGRGDLDVIADRVKGGRKAVTAVVNDYAAGRRKGFAYGIVVHEETERGVFANVDPAYLWPNTEGGLKNAENEWENLNRDVLAPGGEEDAFAPAEDDPFPSDEEEEGLDDPF